MKRFITRYDVLVISFLLLFAILIYCLFVCSFWGKKATQIEVFVDGKEYATYKFSEISGVKNLEIKSDEGLNVLEVSEKGARMLSSTCKDKIDIQCGTVSKPGQIIVCAPNKVVVRIVGETTLSIDKVTY